MMDLRLYLLQRVSALIMAPLVICHLALMIYAIQDGLSASEILARTQGNIAWAAFYGLFALAVATHAAIGLRTIVAEWTPVRGLRLTGFAWLVFVALAYLGLKAVWAVTLSGAGAAA